MLTVHYYVYTRIGGNKDASKKIWVPPKPKMVRFMLQHISLKEMAPIALDGGYHLKIRILSYS
jgi:hypothetical protein